MPPVISLIVKPHVTDRYSMLYPRALRAVFTMLAPEAIAAVTAAAAGRGRGLVEIMGNSVLLKRLV